MGNAKLNYKVTSEIEFKANMGYTSIILNEANLSPKSAFNSALNRTSGAATFGTNSVKTWIVEPQVLFNKDFGEGKLNILLGTTFQQDEIESEVIRARGFSSDALLENLSSASDVRIAGANNSIYRYNAIFGRINYNWREK